MTEAKLHYCTRFGGLLQISACIYLGQYRPTLFGNIAPILLVNIRSIWPFQYHFYHHPDIGLIILFDIGVILDLDESCWYPISGRY